MSSNLNAYVKINETVSSQNREVNPYLNDMSIELISYEDSNNLLTSLNITTGLGNTDKRRTLAKALGFSSGVMLALGASGSRRSTNPVYKKVALTGSWTFAANNTSINGTGGDLLTGDELRANEVVFTSSGLASQVQSVTSDNQFILYIPFEVSGTSVTLYKMIPVSDYLSEIELTTIGYLQSRLTFTGDVLTVYSVAHVNEHVVSIPSSTLTVTGVAGWRYIVVSSLGVITVETIPVAEITADTTQYTPSPVFNTSANGYYSTVNTTKRIIGVLYFDETDILETIAYGIGKRKNDDYYYSGNAGVGANSVGSRLQFTASFDKSRGTNISVVDNGAGTTDSEGFRITSQNVGKLRIGGSLSINSASGTAVNLNKNGASYYPDFFDLTTSNATLINSTTPFCFYIPVQKNDYFVFNVSTIQFGSANLRNIEISFEEN
jgi:hypothetical protein